MSREHKYRGLTGTGKWFYGYYCYWQNRHYIVPLNEVYEDGFHGGEITTYSLAGWRLVKPVTVGEFIGKRDRKRTKEYPIGQEIYEGDKLNCWDWGREPNRLLTVSTVCWEEAAWCLDPDPTDGDRYDLFRNIEVVGNIHDAPEKLGE